MFSKININNMIVTMLPSILALAIVIVNVYHHYRRTGNSDENYMITGFGAYLISLQFVGIGVIGLSFAYIVSQLARIQGRKYMIIANLICYISALIIALMIFVWRYYGTYILGAVFTRH
jgi:hypothetical protein